MGGAYHGGAAAVPLKKARTRSLFGGAGLFSMPQGGCGIKTGKIPAPSAKAAKTANGEIARKKEKTKAFQSSSAVRQKRRRNFQKIIDITTEYAILLLVILTIQ